MAIELKNVNAERSLKKIGSALSEATVQGLLLGSIGFGNPIPALFRILDSLKGDDKLEIRACNLIIDTISLASLHAMNTSAYDKHPIDTTVALVCKNITNKIIYLIKNGKYSLEGESLSVPNSINIIKDFSKYLFLEMQALSITESEAEFNGRFRACVDESFQKSHLNKPIYYSPLFDALTGPDLRASKYAKSWLQYRSELVRRFNETPLFAQETEKVTLSQVYVPLRGWWIEETDDSPTELKFKVDLDLGNNNDDVYNTVWLENELESWLECYSRNDQIRLISGGPGSGKSTFAKRLAASYATKNSWRTLLVPLQRLKGSGNLENRINTYFIDYDEPFQRSVPPILDIGADEYKDWLIIFDGLDELGREGTTSERVAQEFASALIDWSAQIGSKARVRMVVLGRVPSMQEALQRLSMNNNKVLYVADFRPIKQQLPEDLIKMPKQLDEIDQRADYWQRWAFSKKLDLALPEALRTSELDDLTKEPLLCHLLIISGYTGDNWVRAANNRNLIYEGIFKRIYERERQKETRNYLNTIGYSGFAALMQALGLAAWRGGGRTGDQSTYITISDVFVRRSILNKAAELGADNLSNVAVLFYTKKDDQGDQGYEFLHKSFGEYLTAKALMDAFMRWATQVEDEDDEFEEQDFLSRWMKVVGSAQLNIEIYDFLVNEARLICDRTGDIKKTRQMARVCAKLFSSVLAGTILIPATVTNYREARNTIINTELSLLALLNSLSRAAYPNNLYKSSEDGWTSGPIQIPELINDSNSLIKFCSRHLPENQHRLYDVPSLGSKIFSHLDLSGADLDPYILRAYDMTGCNLNNSTFYFGYFSLDLSFCDLIGSDLSGVNFRGCSFDFCCLNDADLTNANFQQCSFTNATMNEARAFNSNLNSQDISNNQRDSISWKSVSYNNNSDFNTDRVDLNKENNIDSDI